MPLHCWFADEQPTSSPLPNNPANFGKAVLRPYLDEADLDPLAHGIIECCLDGGTLDDCAALIPREA
jgi:hypothetical protein